MNYGLIGGIILIVLCIVYIFFTYNKLISLSNDVNEAFSTMDVYLKKRWDLIPNIVESVKGYSKHEKETLEDVISLRNYNYDNLSNDEKISKNQQMTSDIVQLMLVAEKYPELKADTHFLSLQKDLTQIEDEISQSRKYYNAVVRNYNNKVQMIPSNIVAKIFRFKVKKMFEANSDERENVKVEV